MRNQLPILIGIIIALIIVIAILGYFTCNQPSPPEPPVPPPSTAPSPVEPPAPPSQTEKPVEPPAKDSPTETPPKPPPLTFEQKLENLKKTIADVRASGELASALGEGFADGLDVAGF